MTFGDTGSTPTRVSHLLLLTLNLRIAVLESNSHFSGFCANAHMTLYTLLVLAHFVTRFHTFAQFCTLHYIVLADFFCELSFLDKKSTRQIAWT